MRHAEGTMSGAGGLPLHYEQWYPEKMPRAAVVLAHGYGEHIGRYSHLIQALVERGYALSGLDHRGYGRSAGERANVRRFDDYVTDLDRIVTAASHGLPGRPLFLLGHSMGGLIAIRYALWRQDKLDGLVLSGPALQIGDEVSPMLKRLGKVISILAPSLPVVNSTEYRLSRDEEVHRLFADDPLTYKGKAKARLAQQMFEASIETRARLEELRLPLLVMHGTADRITNPAGSQLLYDRAQSEDKTLKWWDDFWHEIFNEPEKDQVLEFMIQWLDQRGR